MRGITIVVLIGIFLIVSVGATVYSSKTNTITQIQTDKLSISKTINQIEYINNPTCNVDYGSELVTSCEVCFMIEIPTQSIAECIKVSETATSKEIDSQVRIYAREYVDNLYKSKSYEFETLNIKGDIISP